MEKEDKMIIFDSKDIRRTWFNDEWYYSLVDIVFVLTDSKNATDYLKKVRKRDFELNKYLGTNCPHVEMFTISGKKRLTLAGNLKNIFRLIQSIPSIKAEPFKQWLAQLGQDRIQEIENPEIAQNRVKEYYEIKGYSKNWVDKRLRGIAIRQNLTEEWQNRELKTKKDFSILTNEIHKATFDFSVKQHKELKSINIKSNINLRDNMTDLELIFSMLGEKATTEITQTNNSMGFENLKKDAIDGGNIARNARLELEEKTGKKVISKENNFKKLY